jgi:hypothetical protein
MRRTKTCKCTAPIQGPRERLAVARPRPDQITVRMISGSRRSAQRGVTRRSNGRIRGSADAGPPWCHAELTANAGDYELVASIGASSVLKQTFSNWSNHKCSTFGAALAYYSIFSFGPLMLIATVIAGMVFGTGPARSAARSASCSAIPARRRCRRCSTAPTARIRDCWRRLSASAPCCLLPSASWSSSKPR